MLAIVVSRADSASVHIGEHLLDITDWETVEDESRSDAAGGRTVYRTEGVELREFEALHLDLQRPADAFDDPDLLVFASRHSGETGPLLTAHHTGNFGPADHGGEADALARACPNAHAAVIDALERHAPEAYEVGMECTHHGPSEVGVPSMFVEVGSAEPQWEDPEAARAVARAILDLRGVPADCDPENGGDETRRHLVGFGGGHYAPRFERVARETNWAIGHIAADWGLDATGEFSETRVLARAFEQSRAAYALVDGDRPAVEEAVERAGYRAVGETWVRETDGVDLAFVRAVEDEVTTVEGGLRFGEPAESFEGTDFAVVSLPEKLLDEARGIDREATWDCLAETALAVVTDQGGTRPAGPAVVATEGDREALVDALVGVLRERYESVERNGDEVLARTETFDPEKAETLGVPEGPKFGRLASGEAIEVGGRTIPPEQVRTEEKRRFPLE
jgi:D-aminoacyl-tRNA deacylase